MLKRLSHSELLQTVAAERQATLVEEWLAALLSIKNGVTIKGMVAEIERGNIESVIRMLDMDASRFARFERAIYDTWNQGGQAHVNGMPALRDGDGNLVHFSWGVRNVAAEQAIRNHAATLVDGLVDEQLTVTRMVLVDGLSRGQNPRQTALQLVGPINRATGAREGGIIGLSSPSVTTANKIYMGLRTGDEQAMRDYLGYTLRDKRFDGHVRRALEAGKTVPAGAVDRITTAYTNRALKYRADNIALTETNIALAQAKTDAFQQQINAGKLDAQDVTKTWGVSVSKEKREDHLAMVGQSIPFGELFTLPDGTQCTGPHDPNLPAKHLVGCMCIMDMTVDFTAQALRKYRARVGG